MKPTQQTAPKKGKGTAAPTQQPSAQAQPPAKQATPLPDLIKAKAPLPSLLKHPDMLAQMKGVANASLDMQREIAFAIQACNSNPELAQCERGSILSAVFNAWTCGLSLNPAMPEGYLVPFAEKAADGSFVKKAKFLPGYRGKLRKVYESGEIAYLDVQLIRAKDEFKMTLGTAPSITHSPSLEDSDVIGVYAVARMKPPYDNASAPVGEPIIVHMNKAELEAVKAQSRAASSKYSPYTNFAGEMAKKSCLSRLLKRLPISVKSLEVIAEHEAEFTESEVINDDVSFTHIVSLIDSLPAEEQAAWRSRLKDAMDAGNDDAIAGLYRDLQDTVAEGGAQ